VGAASNMKTKSGYNGLTTACKNRKQRLYARAIQKVLRDELTLENYRAWVETEFAKESEDE